MSVTPTSIPAWVSSVMAWLRWWVYRVMAAVQLAVPRPMPVLAGLLP